jgi:hypothetical protein
MHDYALLSGFIWPLESIFIYLGESMKEEISKVWTKRSEEE